MVAPDHRFRPIVNAALPEHVRLQFPIPGSTPCVGAGRCRPFASVASVFPAPGFIVQTHPPFLLSQFSGIPWAHHCRMPGSLGASWTPSRGRPKSSSLVWAFAFFASEAPRGATNL